MIVTTKELFEQAYGKYAVGAYNINNLEQTIGLFRGNLGKKDKNEEPVKKDAAAKARFFAKLKCRPRLTDRCRAAVQEYPTRPKGRPSRAPRNPQSRQGQQPVLTVFSMRKAGLLRRKSYTGGARGNDTVPPLRPDSRSEASQRSGALGSRSLASQAAEPVRENAYGNAN